VFFSFDILKQKQRNFIKKQIIPMFLGAILLTGILFPTYANAHAYSVSYTTIKVGDTETNFVFSIDSLSIIELIEDIDRNGDEKLSKKEIAEESEHLDELIHHRLAFEQNNLAQEPELEKMELEEREGKQFLSFYLTYPGYSIGDTISFTDGLYTNDPETNYVNLISFDYKGAASQGIIQGKNRTWTILLSETQQEQSTDGSNQEGQQDEQEVPQDSSKPVTEGSTSWFAFFKLGMLHILTGYDHLLFLLVLLLRKQTLKQYVAIITSFTIAHSITISLAVLGIVTLPSRFVEATIAFSICYVALENIFRKEIKYRWGLTFLFGLIHGLGFANILKEMNIPKSDLAVALLNFNIGIEIVQLAIVVLLLPLLIYIQKQEYYGKIVKIGSIIITLLGAFWLLERIFS
jgi:hydrogenase/urease accessory protein HupE